MSDYTWEDYWASVRSIVSDIMEEHAPSLEEADYDAARDAVWESVDGSCWVIYYARAFAALQHSENETAIDEHGDGERCDFWTYITRAAFYAMAADVSDRLETAISEHEEAVEAAAEHAAGVDV